jgi:hypothetical protein
MVNESLLAGARGDEKPRSRCVAGLNFGRARRLARKFKKLYSFPQFFDRRQASFGSDGLGFFLGQFLGQTKGSQARGLFANGASCRLIFRHCFRAVSSALLFPEACGGSHPSLVNIRVQSDLLFWATLPSIANAGLDWVGQRRRSDFVRFLQHRYEICQKKPRIQRAAGLGFRRGQCRA